MQLYNCVVRHAGNLGMTVHKIDLSAAEIVVLRHLHGADAVVNVSPSRETRLDSRKVRERLVELYGDKAVVECFPGATPRLPATLAEAGVEEEGEAAAANDSDEHDEHGDTPASDRTLPPPPDVAGRLARTGRTAKDLI